MPKGAEPELMEKWKIQDAVETYGVRHWGKGYFGINKAGHVTVHPNKQPEQVHRPQGAGRSAAGPRHPAADPAPLHRHPPPPRRRDPRRLPDRHQRVRLPGRLLLRLPDQGQPAAARRRGDPRLRQAVPLRPGSRLQAGAAGRAGPDQRPGHADHLQRLQGRRVHQDDHAGPQDRQADHPRGREVHRAGSDRPLRRGAERPAGASASASSWRRAAPAAGSTAPASAPSSA